MGSHHAGLLSPRLRWKSSRMGVEDPCVCQNWEGAYRVSALARGWAFQESASSVFAPGHFTLMRTPWVVKMVCVAGAWSVFLIGQGLNMGGSVHPKLLWPHCRSWIQGEKAMEWVTVSGNASLSWTDGSDWSEFTGNGVMQLLSLSSSL